jgi:hypothetical protein
VRGIILHRSFKIDFFILPILVFFAPPLIAQLGSNSQCGIPSKSVIDAGADMEEGQHYLDAKVEPTGFGEPLGLRIDAPSKELIKSGVKFRDILVGVRNNRMPVGKFYVVSNLDELDSALKKMPSQNIQIVICRFGKGDKFRKLSFDINLKKIPQTKSIKK